MSDPVVIPVTLALAVVLFGLAVVALIEQLIRSTGFGVAVTLVLVGEAVVLVALARHLSGPAVAGRLLAVDLILVVVPLVVFAGLRVEAAVGGRGDRFLVGSPAVLELGTVLILLASGAAIGVAVTPVVTGARPVAAELAVPNLISASALAGVAVLLFRSQLWRHRLGGGWSVSGLSLTLGLVGLAQVHLALGLASDMASPGLTLMSWIGAGAVTVLLVVVAVLYHEAGVRWRAEPVNRARVPRPAPWAV